MAELSGPPAKGTTPTPERRSLTSAVLNAPFDLSWAILARAFAILRPYTPQLIPLLVYAFFIPLILTISLGAGYFVYASLSSSWEVPLYLQYGDGVPPYAYVQLPRIMTQQQYAVSVDLVLPYSGSNLDLGNFMTSVTLSTLSNKTLAYIRRPTIAMPSKSFFSFRTPSTFSLKVPLLDSFVSTTPNVAANVEIGRRDGWATLGNGQGREVSILSASLRGLAVPHGIRGLAIRFPLLSSLAASAIFFTVLSFILGLCVLPLVVGQEAQEVPSTTEKVEVNAEKKRRDSSSSQISIEGRRRRQSRSSKSRDASRVKSEAPETIIPPTEESSSNKTLRQRSSRTALGAPESET